ncbi:adenylosuccinate lyase [Rhizobium mongolense]
MALGGIPCLGERADLGPRSALDGYRKLSARPRHHAQDAEAAEAFKWQNERAPIADLANLFSLITGSLGKMGQDIALLAQAGGEIELAGGVRSSAMVHKQNPVGAETLVAFSRFNAAQLSAIHQALVHEQERSGAAWTLEWLVLPQWSWRPPAPCGLRAS